MSGQEANQKNALDQNKIQKFMNKAVADIAGSSTAMLVIIGERLGLYRAMAQIAQSQSKNLLTRLELLKD
jgi:hypothetical protein